MSLSRSPSDAQVQMDLGTFEVRLKYLVAVSQPVLLMKTLFFLHSVQCYYWNFLAKK